MDCITIRVNHRYINITHTHIYIYIHGVNSWNERPETIARFAEHEVDFSWRLSVVVAVGDQLEVEKQRRMRPYCGKWRGTDCLLIAEVEEWTF